MRRLCVASRVPALSLSPAEPSGDLPGGAQRRSEIRPTLAEATEESGPWKGPLWAVEVCELRHEGGILASGLQARGKVSAPRTRMSDRETHLDTQRPFTAAAVPIAARAPGWLRRWPAAGPVADPHPPCAYREGDGALARGPRGQGLVVLRVERTKPSHGLCGDLSMPGR